MSDLITLLVPFFFVLAIVYGALEVSDVFKRKQVRLIISLCFAFFAMSNQMLTSFVMSILPVAVLLFIAIFFISFVMKFFKGGEKGERDYTLIIIVLVLFLIFAANYGLGFIEDMLPGVSSNDLITGIGLVIMLMIFYAVYKKWG